MNSFSMYSFFTFKHLHLYAHFFAFFLFLELLLCFLFKEETVVLKSLTSFVKERRSKKISAFIIIFITFLMVFLSNPQTYVLFGSTDIRLFPEGTYCRYVYAEYNNKTYTLPAEITKYRTDIETGGFVRNVYFENGGYLFFDDSCNLLLTENYYDIVGDGIDQQDREWSIRVSHIPTQHEKIITTKYQKPIALLLPLFEFITLLFSLINFYKKNDSKE